MKRVLIVFMFLSGYLGWACPTGIAYAAGVNYYVSALTGSDSNDGLMTTSAFRTISKASEMLAPSDSVFVLDGVYKESIEITVSSVSYHAIGHVLMTGDLTDTGEEFLENAFVVVNSSGVHITGFIICAYSDNGILISNSQEVVASSNVILNFQGADGIEVNNSIAIIESNIIIGNDRAISGESSNIAVIVRNNICYGNLSGIRFTGGGDIWINNNTVYGNTDYGQTGYLDGYGIYTTGTATENIAVGNGTGIFAAGGSSRNIAWENSSNFETPLGVGDIVADPLFSNVFLSDFSLLAGSPAIGAGETGRNIGAVPTPIPAPPYLSYYVSPDGADEVGKGTQSEPWRTIDFAAKNALPYSTILISTGVYKETVTLTIPYTSYEGNGRVILSGDLSDTASPELSPAFIVSGLVGIQINGFILRQYSTAGIQLANSYAVLIASNIIQNSIEASGIMISGSNALITSNILLGNERGIYGEGPNIAVEASNNISYGNLSGIRFSDEGYIRVNNNTVYGNVDYGQVGDSDGYGIYTTGTATENIAVGNGTGIFAADGSSRNIAWGNSSNFETPLGVGDIVADPLFSNVFLSDFSLLAGSPAIGAGETGRNIGAVPTPIPAPPYLSYYVSPDGADEVGKGTQSEPWRTIDFAAKNALPYSTILVSTGVYKEAVFPTRPLLEFRALGEVLMSGDVSSSGVAELEDAFAVISLHNIKVSGFTIRDYSNTGVNISQSYAVNIQGNDIRNNINASGIKTADASGLLMLNVLHGNERGIGSEAFNLSVSVRQNVCFENLSGIRFPEGGDIFVINNTVYNNRDPYHTDLRDGYGIYTRLASKNNIAVGNDIGIFASAESGFNNSWNNHLGDYAPTDQVYNTNNISIDPQFVSDTIPDFRLLEGSPSLGTGENGINMGYYLGPGINIASSSLLGVTPSSGPIGVPFTIEGTGFGTYSVGTTVVLLAGTTAPLTLWTDTKIQGTIPGVLPAGEYPVVVKRGAEVLAEVSPFTVTQPALYALTPSSGAIGLPFTITGESFGNYVAGFTRVLLGGATMPLTLWTDTRIQGTIPGTLPVGDYELLVERALNGGVVRTSTTTFSLRNMEAYWPAPSSGSIGMPFTITGVGFGNYSSGYTHVLIGGTTAPLTLWTDSKIQGTVPGSLASGQYPVLVERKTSDGGVMQTLPMTFEVVTVDVASMTPVTGPIGLPFTIYGGNFGNYVANYTRVLIGGTTAPLTLWTADKIQGTIPGALGPDEYPVIVERELNGGVVQSSALAFVVSTPTAYNITPSSGPIGMPFTINGESFGNYSVAYTGVLINGATVPLTLWTDTQIKGTIPGNLAPGQYPVVVGRRTSDGGAVQTEALTFEVVGVNVASMTPVAGPIGLPFTIYGNNFGNYAAGYTKVLMGGTTCPLTLWTDTKIQGTVPGNLAAGEHPVVLERSLNGGQVQSVPVAFSVAVPEAYSLSPSSGPIGLPLTIMGANFGNYVANYTKVLIGGAAAPLTLWTDSKIQGAIPGTLPAGDHEVIVERALNGGVVRTSTFTFVVGTPYLGGVSPSTAAVTAPFTVTGYNFGNYVANSTKVLINGATTALTLWTDTKIQGKLPFLLAGTYPVQVQRYLNGGLAESATTYINIEEPVISSMTPVSGAVGTVFSIYGSGFGPYDASIAKAFIGGVQCALSLWTDTRITGTVPSGLSYGTHTVVAMRGQALSNGLEFYIPGGYSPSMMRPGTGPSALEFKLGEVYVYPDPAKGGKVPTFHIEVGTADSVKLKVYTVAGQLAHEATLTGSPQAVGPAYAYEYAWTGRIASGVYYYTMEAERAGKKLKAKGRFAVVR